MFEDELSVLDSRLKSDGWNKISAAYRIYVSNIFIIMEYLTIAPIRCDKWKKFELLV